MAPTKRFLQKIIAAFCSDSPWAAIPLKDDFEKRQRAGGAAKPFNSATLDKACSKSIVSRGLKALGLFPYQGMIAVQGKIKRTGC